MASEAEVEAAGRARVRQLIAGNRFGLWQITDPARIEMAVEQCWKSQAADLLPVLNAAAAVRQASAGEAALREEVERLREWDSLRGLDLMTLADKLTAAETALAQARAENERLWAELELARGVGR